MQGDPFLDAFERRYGSGSAQDDPFLAAYQRRYGSEPAPAEEKDKPSVWGGFVRGAKDFGAQAMRGLGEAGTSTVGAIGSLTGSDTLKDWAKRSEEEMAQFYGEAEGGAGTAGRAVGRVVGEIGSAVAGGGAVAGATKAFAKTGLKGAATAAKLNQALTSGSALKRAGSSAILSAPIDVVQGYKSEDGMVLPGQAGAVAENVLFSGAAGAIPWQRIFGGAKVPKGPDLPITDEARLLPATTTTTEPVTIPGNAGMPPMTVGQRVVQEPLTPQAARAEIPYGPAIPTPSGEAAAGPQIGQVRALLTGSSTETAPRIIPASGDFPAMVSTEREVIRTPLTQRADVPQNLPAAPWGEVPLGPQQGQIRGLLTGTSTETAPVIIPATPSWPQIGGYPAMNTGRREVVSEPLTARAAVPEQRPPIPMPARTPEDVLPPQQGQARGLLPEPRAEGPAIPQGSGLIPESRRLPAVSSADDAARRAAEAEAAAEAAAERAAIEAAEQADEIPDVFGLPLETLAERVKQVKPLPRSPGGLANLPEEDLLVHVAYRTAQASKATGIQDQLDNIGRILEDNATGNYLSRAKARELYGGSDADIRQYTKFTEEQIEALRDLDIDPLDIPKLRKELDMLTRGTKQGDRALAEFNRRQSADVSFDPSEFDRSGFASTQVLSTLAGGGTGAALGAAGAAPEDRGAGAVLGGLIGAGVGAGAGRVLARGFGGAPPARADGAVPPVTPPIGEQAVQRRARAEEAITFPAKPTPRSAEYQPISEQAMRERLQRRLKDPEKVEELLGKWQRGEALQRQGRRLFADDIDMVDDLWRDLAEPELMDPKRSLTGAEVAVLDRRAEQLVSEQKRMQQMLLDESVSTERKALLQQYLQDVDRQIVNVVTRTTRDASQKGRDLAALRHARRTSNNPLDWMRRVVTLTDGELPPESWANIQKALEAKDFAKAQIELGKLRKNTLWDKVGELWQTGLLTNVGRPFRDVISNTVNLTDRQLERATATVFDRLVGAYTGARTAAYDASSLRAAKGGFRKGYQAAKSIVRGSTADLTDPKFLDRVMKRYDFERETMQSHPWLRAYTTFVRRTIGASDALVSEAALQASLAEQARVFAMRTTKPGTEAYKTLVAKYLTDMPAEAMGEALSHAMEVTWQNRTALGEAGMALRTAQNPAVRLLGKLAVPFVQTPSAMITQAVKGTPFGLLSPENLGALRDLARRTNMPDAQRKLVNQLAKTSIGSAWIAAGYMLAADDKMTTFYPNDDRERRRWELEGRTEAAVKAFGVWISLLGALGPQAQLMTLGAALRKMTEDDPEWTAGLAAKTMATGVGRAALDSPMLQGIKTISDVAQKAGSADTDALGESLNQAAQTFVTGWVPQVVQQAARATDVTPEGLVRVRQVREPGDPAQTAINALMQGIPVLRQQVPVRRNALGEERATSMGGPWVAFPARLTRETDDPRAQELWRTGAAIARTPRRKGESQQMYEARQAALGTAASRAVDAVMNNPGYQGIATMDTQALRMALAGLAATGEVQEKQVREMERMDDDALRARLQGVVLERAISGARSAAGKQFPDPARGRGSLLNALTR